jgi:SET domain-containing protein
MNITDIKTPDNLEVKYINKDIGYGVFTNNEIKKGDIVEVCYCLELSSFTGTFVDYIFIDKIRNLQFMPLGYGSIYNHSYSPNIQWISSETNTKIIIFTSLNDINIGEELRHNYGKTYWRHKEKKIL